MSALASFRFNSEEDAGRYERATATEPTWPDRLGPVPAWWGPDDELPSGEEIAP